MSLLQRLYDILLNRLNASGNEPSERRDRDQHRRRLAVLNHIGDVDQFLGRLRGIDHCRTEDELIDLLAKASMLIKLDSSFKVQFDSLQRSDEISEEGKALLRCVNK